MGNLLEIIFGGIIYGMKLSYPKNKTHGFTRLNRTSDFKIGNLTGFTLIELLVVIVIIGILATLATISLNGVRTKARDARRISDIKQIQTALELYRNEENKYPADLEVATGRSFSSPGGSVYMTKVPSNPTPWSEISCTNPTDYVYRQTDGGASYTLTYCLAEPTSGFPGGVAQAWPGSINNHIGFIASSFICGQNFIDTRDNQSYSTLTYGSQCWFTKNLAYLPSVSPSTVGSSDVSTPYYYVYGYNGSNVTTAKAQSNYTTYGALYNYAAAATACPSGWHLPTNDEWTTLERTICTSNSCSTDFPYDLSTLSPSGTNEGTKLKVGGDSGFNVLLAGLRFGDSGGSFINNGVSSGFWSATTIYLADAFDRLFFSNEAATYRMPNARYTGFSVRCVHD